MYLVYDTPVWSLVMMWSTPSSRNAQVVTRSAVAGGIGYWFTAVMRKEMFRGKRGRGRKAGGDGRSRRKRRTLSAMIP